MRLIIISVVLVTLGLGANLSLSQESASNRNSKIAMLGVESGFGITFPASGIKAGYFISPNLILELSHISGGLEALDVNVDYSLSTLGVKYFMGNSFYVLAGVGQRAFDFSATDATTNIEVSATANSQGADIRIGNHWQWDGFTLGTDWLGYFVPLSSDTSTTIPTGASASSVTDLQDATDKLGEVAHVQFLRLYFGWSF